MKKFYVVLFSVIVLILASGFAPMGQAPEGNVLDKILVIATQFATLAGVSAAITVLGNILVRFGVFKTPDKLSKFIGYANVVAFGVLVGFGIFRPDLSLDFLDSIAAKAASIALFVLGLLTQVTVPGTVQTAIYRADVPHLNVVRPGIMDMER